MPPDDLPEDEDTWDVPVNHPLLTEAAIDFASDTTVVMLTSEMADRWYTLSGGMEPEDL